MLFKLDVSYKEIIIKIFSLLLGISIIYVCTMNFWYIVILVTIIYIYIHNDIESFVLKSLTLGIILGVYTDWYNKKIKPQLKI